MNCITHFDPVFDVCEVDQFGFIDLRSALESGVIPSTSVIEELDITDIDDPTAVQGRPSTVFDVIDAGVSITSMEGVQIQSSSNKEGAD